MASVSLTLENLGDLADGVARAIIDRELAAAVADIDDRGEDGKPRKVTITVQLQKADNGVVAVHVEAKASAPPRRSKSTFGKTRQDARGRSQLFFQSNNAERPDQPTFPALDDGEVPNDE